MEGNIPENTAIRFSLRDLLAMSAYVSVTLGIASWTGSIALGITLSLLLVGWVLWRFAHGHLAGIILALLGGEVLLLSAVGWVYLGIEDFFGFRVLVCMGASVLVLAGLGVFMWAGTKDRPFAKRQPVIAISIFCILVAWWIAIPAAGSAVIARRQASDLAANNTAAAKAIAMVDEVVKQTGGAPSNNVLPKLLAEPMPSVRWGRSSWMIHYQQQSKSTYQLWYVDPGTFFGDIITYDSATPQRGWYRVPF